MQQILLFGFMFVMFVLPRQSAQAQFLDFPTLETFNPLQVTCSESGTQATLSWESLDTADLNEVRIDEISDPFDESCQLADGEDKCMNVSDTSVIIDVTPGKTYNWWIYQIYKGIRGDRLDGGKFSCGASIEPTAIPTNIPSPTTNLTLATQRPTMTPTAAPQCPRKSEGDANCNNVIDLLDFAIWRQEYLSNASSPQADFNSDTTVTILDFAIWRQGYLVNQTTQ